MLLGTRSGNDFALRQRRTSPDAEPITSASQPRARPRLALAASAAGVHVRPHDRRRLPLRRRCSRACVSFLSPCVLPLVPPYLVYLAGTSLERFADAEPEPQVKRETVLAACLFVLGFSTVFVALGASASVIGGLLRAYSRIGSPSSPASPSSSWACTSSASRASRLLMREKRATVPKPVGPVGRLCDGARLRLRLDAVHRPDPRGDPGGRGVRGDGGERARACSRSIRSGSAFRSCSRPSRSSRSRHSCRASASISPRSRR